MCSVFDKKKQFSGKQRRRLGPTVPCGSPASRAPPQVHVQIVPKCLLLAPVYQFLWNLDVANSGHKTLGRRHQDVVLLLLALHFVHSDLGEFPKISSEIMQFLVPGDFSRNLPNSFSIGNSHHCRSVPILFRISSGNVWPLFFSRRAAVSERANLKFGKN